MTTPFFTLAVRLLPDVAAGKRAYGLEKLSDHEASQAISTLRRIRTGSAEWPLPLMRLAAVALAGSPNSAGGQPADFSALALGQPGDDEAALLNALAQAVAQYSGQTLLALDAPEYLHALLQYRSLAAHSPQPALLEQIRTSPAGLNRSGYSAMSFREVAAALGEPLLKDPDHPDPVALHAAARTDALLLYRLAHRLYGLAPHLLPAHF